MYWHEDNIVYYVKGLNFKDKSKWKYICTCTDDDTADHIRNLLSFAEEGFKDVESTIVRLDEVIETIKLNPEAIEEQMYSLINYYMFLRMEVIP